jgi:hypothetical protein
MDSLRGGERRLDLSAFQLAKMRAGIGFSSRPFENVRVARALLLVELLDRQMPGPMRSSNTRTSVAPTK